MPPRGPIPRQEHIEPLRLVTTTVPVEGGRWPRLPVKTTGEIPKALVLDACAVLAGTAIRAPVVLGEVIVEDLLGTGCDVVATRDMPRRDGHSGPGP